MKAVVVALLCIASSASAQTTDSLIAAAQRAAGHWRAHDFVAMVAGARQLEVHLPGTDPSSPVGRAQAVELLKAFVGPSREIEVEVEVARSVKPGRGYVELRRTFVMRPGAERRTQVVYLTLRIAGSTYRVAGVRVVP